ncbi:hypothetical protein Tsubulata_005415 [Turnera subulata]|uniref:Receptor-like serine/threonine-protein kinase n=1 Tax=Turnera subulata TaxID=218843 RepID=A0A9Q0G4F5_9ROSI|nr:hypothetical protein Tsubulata_005415 [Turnera subulata]
MRRKLGGITIQFAYLFIVLSTIRISTAVDTFSPGKPIKDGESIVSPGQLYELGFFSPGSSTRRYLGIWYKRVSTGTVVWVANREVPVLDKSGVLSITDQGILQLSNGTNHVLWSSNVTRTPRNPVAQLLESGNFVVKEGSDSSTAQSSYLWQSFDYPVDTLLPGMKLGMNFVTGADSSFIYSWKSLDDPAKGDIGFGIDSHGFPQLLVTKGPAIEYRLGSFNGLRYTGTPRLQQNLIYKYTFELNEKEVYYHVDLLNQSIATRYVVNTSGFSGRLVWKDETQSWAIYYQAGEDQCDNYKTCGPNAKCNINDSPMCSCFEGFEPKSSRDWDLLDWSSGCVRKDPIDCRRGEGFVKHEGMKLPDTSMSWYNQSMNLQDCEQLCSKKCNCTAYANTDIRGSGCVLWYGDLVDMREYTDRGQDLYIRMSAAYLESLRRQSKARKRKRIAIIICSIIFVMLLLGLGVILYRRRRKVKAREKIKRIIDKYYNTNSRSEDLELPIFQFGIISKATDHFSDRNELGKGGFGPVYKGTLPDGKEVAVKRLSMDSGQGLEEFINEVILIAKLQHRNLVSLLGCCIEEDERILVYEYMSNKSLDCFIFDQSKSRILDSRMRINIIDGIARGLLYLHQDSRLRIIHRDLKTSNILLDKDMVPKISDFGMARIFGGNQTEANTKRVVGTYGYMAPEYAVDGLFSVKSDIFSFGVIVLEIVSGSKNRGFSSHDHMHNLLGHAWKLWTEGKMLELIDNNLDDSSVAVSEIVRCIHVGLLCVQQKPEDRPNMSSVVLMLNGESSLPQPKQPGFFTEREIFETGSSSSYQKSAVSVNEITMTMLDAR